VALPELQVLEAILLAAGRRLLQLLVALVVLD
jgi:hypothetical protein